MNRKQFTAGLFVMSMSFGVAFSMQRALEQSQIDEAIRRSKITAEEEAKKQKKEKNEQEKKDRKMARDLQKEEERKALAEATKRSLQESQSHGEMRPILNNYRPAQPIAPPLESHEYSEGTSQGSLYPRLPEPTPSAPRFKEGEEEVRYDMPQQKPSKWIILCVIWHWIKSIF